MIPQITNLEKKMHQIHLKWIIHKQLPNTHLDNNIEAI